MKTKFSTVIALLLVALLVLGGTVQAQERAPAVTKQSTYLLYPATALTGAGTVYSASPRNVVAGLDASKVNGWANVDVFVTLDVATNGWFTTTLQYSADGANWANADYEYPSQTTSNASTSTWSSGVVTPTSTITSTETVATTNSAATAIATQTFVRYMTADGTEYMSAPTAGEFMRVKIEHSAAVAPTVYTTYRN